MLSVAGSGDKTVSVARLQIFHWPESLQLALFRSCLQCPSHLSIFRDFAALRHTLHQGYLLSNPLLTWPKRQEKYPSQGGLELLSG